MMTRKEREAVVNPQGWRYRKTHVPSGHEYVCDFAGSLTDDELEGRFEFIITRAEAERLVAKWNAGGPSWKFELIEEGEK